MGAREKKEDVMPPEGYPPITVPLVQNAPLTNPDRMHVGMVGIGGVVTLIWTTPNARFPPDNYFQWKDGTNPGVMPTRISDTQLQLTYQVPASPVAWGYTIWLMNPSGDRVSEDPIIDNTRPPLPVEDKGKDKNKDKDKEKPTK
jgi:hypothetical protein